MNAGKLLALCIALVTVLSGCSSTPNGYADEIALRKIKRDFVTNHERLARSYEADNALNEARREWQLIHALAPQRSDTRLEISRLDKEINKRFGVHREAALAAEKRADYEEAVLEWLKSLALQPDNSQAIRKLQNLEGRRAYAGIVSEPRVSDVVAREVDVYTAPSVRSGGAPAEPKTVPEQLADEPLSASIEHPGAERVKADENNRFRRGMSHYSRKEYEAALKFFLQAQQAGEEPREQVERRIAETRRMLADWHYQQGIVAFRSARYGQAVDQFEQALHYVPGHHKARFYRSSAQELREQ